MDVSFKDGTMEDKLWSAFFRSKNVPLRCISSSCLLPAWFGTSIWWPFQREYIFALAWNQTRQLLFPKRFAICWQSRSWKEGPWDTWALPHTAGAPKQTQTAFNIIRIVKHRAKVSANSVSFPTATDKHFLQVHLIEVCLPTDLACFPGAMGK